MTFVKTIAVLAVGVTLIGQSAWAMDNTPEPLRGTKFDSKVVGETGKFLFPLLVQAADGALHECGRTQYPWRGKTIRMCKGSGGLNEMHNDAVTRNK